jgi:uncharacterized phiE125 gp8 family phage protein
MSDDVEGEAPEGEILGADLPVSVAAMRDWLRLGAGDAEDDLLAVLIGAAAGLCEAFTGRWLMVREGEWRGRLWAGGHGARLPVVPVVAVDAVAVLVGGVETLLDAADYAVVIDRDGAATLRLLRGFGMCDLIVRYRAGMAETQAAVPEALRHGVVRMVQHLYETRDASAGAGMPPAAVAALWQPWRMVTLGGVR